MTPSKQLLLVSLSLLPLLLYSFYYFISILFCTDEGPTDTTKELSDSFPNPLELSRLDKFLPKAFPYLIFSSMLSLISALLLLNQGEPTSRHFLSMLFMTAGIGLIPCATLHAFDLLVRWSKKTSNFIDLAEERVLEWWKNEFNFMWKPRGLFFAPVFFGILTLIAEILSRNYAGSPVYVGIVLGAFTVLAGMWCGFGLILFFRFSLLLSHLGRLPIRVTTDRLGVISAGSILAKVWVLAGFLYALYTSTAPLRPGNLALGDAAMVLLALPAGIVIFTGLLMSQFGLHQGMIRYKDRLLRELQMQLRLTEEEFLKGRSQESGERLRHLRDFHNQVSALPEWPFSWRHIIGYGTSTIGSFIPTVLGILKLWYQVSD